jgi:hypothetical protein
MAVFGLRRHAFLFPSERWTLATVPKRFQGLPDRIVDFGCHTKHSRNLIMVPKSIVVLRIHRVSNFKRCHHRVEISTGTLC